MVSNKALPKSIAKDTITVYNYYRLGNGKETYIRTVIDDAYYRETSIDILKTTGNEVEEAVIIKVNHYDNYISKDDWLSQSDVSEKFTFDNSINGRSTIIIKGESAYEFGELEPKELSSKLSEFLNTTNHRLVKDVKEAFYGSESMWHMTVRC